MKITKKPDGTFQIAGITEETLVKITSLLHLQDKDGEIFDAIAQVIGSPAWQKNPRNHFKGQIHDGLIPLDRYNTLMDTLHL